jgi:manganese efflux pump family protein
MTFPTLFLIALGLSMDAFGACIGRGASGGGNVRLSDILRAGMLFGVFATLAPLIGWAVGSVFYAIVAAYDHWVAFALLTIIGLMMMRNGWIGAEPDAAAQGYRALVIIVAALTTSIDAAAVGITLPAFHVNVLLAAGIIGFVTFLAAVSGSLIGRIAGAKLGRHAEILGGVILIVIGVKIVLEHTRFALGVI